MKLKWVEVKKEDFAGYVGLRANFTFFDCYTFIVDEGGELSLQNPYNKRTKLKQFDSIEEAQQFAQDLLDKEAAKFQEQVEYQSLISKLGEKLAEASVSSEKTFGCSPTGVYDYWKGVEVGLVMAIETLKEKI